MLATAYTVDALERRSELEPYTSRNQTCNDASYSPDEAS